MLDSCICVTHHNAFMSPSDWQFTPRTNNLNTAQAAIPEDPIPQMAVKLSTGPINLIELLSS